MIRRSTVILLVVFVVLLAAVLFWQRTKQSEQAKITPTALQEYLFDLDAQVKSLIIEGPGAQAVEVERQDDGQWVLLQPEGEETDTGRVESAITQLTLLRVLANLEQGAPANSAVGLDEPAYVIRLSLDNSASIQAQVGDLTPTDSGYYVLVEGRGMFVVEKFGLQTVLDLVDNPPIMPTPTAEEATPTP